MYQRVPRLWSATSRGMLGVEKESKGDVLVMTCASSRELQIERG